MKSYLLIAVGGDGRECYRYYNAGIDQQGKRSIRRAMEMVQEVLVDVESAESVVLLEIKISTCDRSAHFGVELVGVFGKERDVDVGMEDSFWRNEG